MNKIFALVVILLAVAPARANRAIMEQLAASNNAIFIDTPTASVEIGTVTAVPGISLNVEGAAEFGQGATKSTFTKTGNLLVPGTITAPGGVIGNAATATTANNLAAGAAGSVPYQSGTGVTAMLAAGAATQALVGGASAPAWSTVTGSTIAANISGLAAKATALGSTPTNCGALAATGIDASGNAVGCFSVGTGDVVKASTQTFSGLNTFAGGVVISSGIYGVGVRDQFRNLTSSPTVAFPLTSINISADEALLENAANYLLYAQGVNVTITTGTAGLNGLDTGSPAASTWYYSWVISNGSTLGGLISLSSATPTMPGAYIYKALVGAVLLDGSKQVVAYRQFGKRVSMANTQILNASIGPTSYLTLSLATVIPANVVAAVRGMFGTNGSAQRAIEVATDSNGMGSQMCQPPTGTMLDGVVGCSYYVNVYVSQTIFWKTQDTSAVYNLTVNGFDLK